jgi:hypothetical protein
MYVFQRNPMVSGQIMHWQSEGITGDQLIIKASVRAVSSRSGQSQTLTNKHPHC